MPSKRSCSVCHNGPLPRGPEATRSRAFPAEVTLAPLPKTSDDFPATVLIKRLAREYKPSLLPHLKMVLKLDAIVRKSRLARQFHGVTEVTCAACHHRSPVSKRPASCASCHGPRAHRTRDQPGLKAAYHRQCIGCHQRMGIKEQGCTDCHEERKARKGGSK
jgi:predicted CXXCH cytochrome family protein